MNPLGIRSGGKQACRHLANSLAIGYEVINLGGGNTPLSINAMIAILEARLGKKAQIDHKPCSEADMRETCANIEKARHLLGWNPEVSPEDGFRALADWYIREADWLAPEIG